jgi:hypothetical protein
MKTITRYESFDGQLFTDRVECEKHEASMTLVKRLNAFLKDDADCTSDDYDVKAQAIYKEEKLNVILENWKNIEALVLEIHAE